VESLLRITFTGITQKGNESIVPLIVINFLSVGEYKKTVLIVVKSFLLIHVGNLKRFVLVNVVLNLDKLQRRVLIAVKSLPLANLTQIGTRSVPLNVQGNIMGLNMLSVSGAAKSSQQRNILIDIIVLKNVEDPQNSLIVETVGSLLELFPVTLIDNSVPFPVIVPSVERLFLKRVLNPFLSFSIFRLNKKFKLEDTPLILS